MGTPDSHTVLHTMWRLVAAQAAVLACSQARSTPAHLKVWRVQLRRLQRVLPHVRGPVARVHNVV